MKMCRLKGKFMKISYYLNKLAAAIEFLSALSLAISLILVLTQVLFRYVFNNPLGFTQELSIYGMISCVLFGSVIAFKKGTHLLIEVVFNNRRKKSYYVVLLLSSLISIAFFVLLAYQGNILSMRAMLQRSPQTGIPVGYITYLIPICSSLSVIYLISYTIKKFKE